MTTNEPSRVPLVIDGERVESASDEWIPVTDPVDQSVIAQVPVATDAELERALSGAEAAYRSWRSVPVQERTRYLLRYQALLKEHHDALAALLAQETGKTLADARGELGAKMNRLDLASERREDFKLELEKIQSELGDADIMKAYSELTQRRTVLQGAMQSSLMLQRTTILNHL